MAGNPNNSEDVDKDNMRTNGPNIPAPNYFKSVVLYLLYGWGPAWAPHWTFNLFNL